MDDGTASSEQELKQGRGAAMKRRGLRSLATLAVLLTTAACGTATTAGGEGTAATEVHGTTTSQPVVDGAKVAEIAPELPYSDCGDLIKKKWQAASDGILDDVAWEPQSGEAVFTFGEERTRVNVDTDPRCLDVPDLGRYIKDMKANYEVDRGSECKDLAQQLTTSTFPEKNGYTPKEEDVRAHMLSFCDKAFLDSVPKELLRR